MNSIIEALELQFINLNQEIQMEKRRCDSLNMQVKRIKDSCLSNKEIIEVKNILKINISDGIKCLENNVQSSRKSLNITSDLENELKKIVKQQNKEDPKEKLIERQRNYEEQWNEIKNTYEKLPGANDVQQSQVLTKQMTLEIHQNMKDLNDTKEIKQKHRNIKEIRTKSQIVNVLKASKKNEESTKRNLLLRGKLRSLNTICTKLKVARSSLTGKQYKTLTPRRPIRKPELADGFGEPSSHGILGKSFQATNIYQKPSFSPGIIPTVNVVPELMIPPFMYVKYKNSNSVSPATKPNLFPTLGNGQKSYFLSDENSRSPIKKRKKEDHPISTPYINISNAKDEAPHSSKTEDIFIVQEFPKTSSNKPIMNYTNRAGYVSNAKDKIQKPDRPFPHVQSRKYFPYALQELPPQLQSAPFYEANQPKSGGQNTSIHSMNQKDCLAESTFNFGMNGGQLNLENGISGVKPKSKNVWDIFS